MKSFEDLLKEAESLGIPTNSGLYKSKSDSVAELQITRWELHRRIKEEQRHRREHRIWIVALVASAAAVLSAMASWAAVIFG